MSLLCRSSIGSLAGGVFPQCKLCRRPARSHRCCSWTRLRRPLLYNDWCLGYDSAECRAGAAVAVLRWSSTSLSWRRSISPCSCCSADLRDSTVAVHVVVYVPVYRACIFPCRGAAADPHGLAVADHRLRRRFPQVQFLVTEYMPVVLCVWCRLPDSAKKCGGPQLQFIAGRRLPFRAAVTAHMPQNP